MLWDARQTTGGAWNAASGAYFSSGGLYTVTIAASNGTSITTQAAVGGATFTASCTTNTTAGTEDQVTVGSNSQIAGGMIVTGTGIPTSPNPTYVKMTGQTGTWNTNLTMFRLETWDNTSGTWTSVDATAAATSTLIFKTGFRGIFGGLLPNNTGGLGSGTYYILTVKDDDDCEVEQYFTICESAGTTGCLTASAVNYDAGFNLPCVSCCIVCNASDGQLSDPNLAYSGDLFNSGSVITGDVTHSSGTIQTDGVFDITANMQGTAASYLQSDGTQSYTMTLIGLATQGDITSTTGTVATQTGITVVAFGGSPSHQFTSLAYGHYAVKVELEDSTTGSPPGDDSALEPCYTYFYGTIKAPVCDDQAAANFNTTIPANLSYPDNTALCTYPVACCTVNTILEDITIRGTECNPFLFSEVQCNPASTSVSGYWEYNGTQIPDTAFAIGTVSGTSTTIWLQHNSNYANLFNLDGTYTLYIEAQYASAPTCNTNTSASFILPVCGCTDPTAYNYNANANIDDASCINQSWDCGSNYQCTDPGTGNGAYASLAACQSACVQPVGGCRDACAINYNSTATFNDGSCIYKACTDPGAANYEYSCDCSQQMSSSIHTLYNDPGCCSYPCLTPNSVTSVTTDSSGSCTVPSADGDVVLTVVIHTAAPTWTVSYYDNTNTSLILTDTNIYTGSTSSNAYSTVNTGLVAGNYWARVEDSLGCVENHSFTINTTSLTQGCMDPTADNYSAAAQCNDGSCLYCGCTNLYANNYNPNASCDDGSCTYTIPDNPCVPPNVDDRILEIDACLSEKGAEWLSNYKIGTSDDCTIMNKWKLILIQYLLNQKGLTCLYNCADASSPSITSISTCGLLGAVGGPTTGYNDQGHAGSSISTSLGTEITNPSLYFILSNTLYYGDVITMPSGLVWKMVKSGSCTYGCYNPESNQGATSGNWVQCVDVNNITAPNNINYIDNFINFANKYCRDCKITVKGQGGGYVPRA